MADAAVPRRWTQLLLGFRAFPNLLPGCSWYLGFQLSAYGGDAAECFLEKEFEGILAPPGATSPAPRLINLLCRKRANLQEEVK